MIFDLFQFVYNKFSLLFFSIAFCDAPVSWQFGFQDPATPVMEGIIQFHHDLIFLLILIVVFVGWMMFRCIVHFNAEDNPIPSNNVHGTVIEIVWTIIPAVILIFIAVPSFALLQSVDEVVEPSLTLKVIGHQWYWSYEYSDYSNEDGECVAFDSYMLPQDDLEEGQLRNLSVDNDVVLPVDTHIRVIITAADVLHCWAIPSCGIKIDACPGRLNQTSLYIKRPGFFQGQCSEICGVNHGFMPICVRAVSLEDQVSWIANRLEEALLRSSTRKVV